MLIYYANASALTQPAVDRRWPRWLHLLDILGCLALVTALPWPSVLAGPVMFALGLAGRWLIRRRRAAPTTFSDTAEP